MQHNIEQQNTKFCKCGSNIPSARQKLGYSVCVECSSEPAWSCSALTYHKTGNTIEIIKDPEVAYNINQMANRKSFGVMNGITGNWSRYRKPNTDAPKKSTIDRTGEIVSEKRVSITIPECKEDRFDTIGPKAIAMDINDALDYVREQYKDGWLTQDSFVRLCIIIKHQSANP
jgi:hypothetical protein